MFAAPITARGAAAATDTVIAFAAFTADATRFATAAPFPAPTESTARPPVL